MSNLEASDVVTGRLRKYHSDFYYVDVPNAEGEAPTLYECKLRGLLKKEGTEVLVGDQVTLDSIDTEARTARVASVLPRSSVITRPKVANIDQVLILYSLHQPEFDPQQCDRYLTHVALAGIRPILVISKTDLVKDERELAEIKALYGDKLGYAVYFTSINDPDSLQPVLDEVRGKISVLAGPSGSGKSSLLNAINPAFSLRVGEVSEKLLRGQHTTRHVELLALGQDTYIADTPGFSNLRLNTVMPKDIEAIFPDFAPYRADCEFSDCLHLPPGEQAVTNEADSVDPNDETQSSASGCAVLAHLEAIADSRYTSYQTMIDEAHTYKQDARSSSAKDEYGAKKLSKKGGETQKIVRLKERHRDASRKVHRQQMDQYIGGVDDLSALEEYEHEFEEVDADISEPPDIT